MSFEIIRDSDLWAHEDVLEGYARLVFEALDDFFDSHDHINFAFADDARVQALNLEFRKKDKPTNVLSFPDGDEGPEGELMLGDIILAYETVAAEATEQGKDFAHHVVHLMLHGALHLLGYDHITKEDAEEMEGVEISALAKIGIPNPY